MGRYYKTGYVRPEILKHAPTLEEIDTRPRDKDGNLKNIHSADAIYPQAKGTPQQYKELGLNYYRNFDSFYNYMRGLNKDATQRIKKPIATSSNAYKWYEEYLRRDYLIATGQYKDVITNIYKKSFIKVIDESLQIAVPSDKKIIQEIRYNISKLNLDEFNRLIRQPNKPSKAQNFALEVFQFYSMLGAQQDDDNTPSNYRDNIRNLFEQNKINWTNLEDDTEESEPVSYVRSPYYVTRNAYQRRYNDKSTSKILRTASKTDLQFLRETTTENVAGALLYRKQLRATTLNKSYIKYRKDGSPYVPFVDRETSNNILSSYFNYIKELNK